MLLAGFLIMFPPFLCSSINSLWTETSGDTDPVHNPHSPSGRSPHHYRHHFQTYSPPLRHSLPPLGSSIPVNKAFNRVGGTVNWKLRTSDCRCKNFADAGAIR
ncbi:hypothetical protein L1987_67036 [Smallanthus sonchifolius]|uniref:Uncharacterized protein n=1 Tax=Smallanthus sonchifolius TaxID=185202 RepID=A0ACB9BZ52_9ASTR|nr:hypothetical protein L1987_67036 [Smallanthus sonchifolius]